MTDSRPRSLKDLLQSGGLSQLRAEAEARRALVSRVRAELPEAASAHVVSASLDRDGSLVVGMDSAAWAARLRYDRDSLLGYVLRVRVVTPG